MGRLTQSFTHLEIKADTLSAAQSRQEDTQSRLHSRMEIDMQVAQGYLSEVASSAMQLQTTVTDTSSKIQSMASFAKVFGTVFDWTIIIVVIILLVVGGLVLRAIWRFSKLAGCCLLILTGTFFLVAHYICADQKSALLLARDYASMIPRVKVNLPAIPEVLLIDFQDPFFRASFIFGFILSIGMIYLATRKRRTLDRASWLDVIHLPSFPALRWRYPTRKRPVQKHEA